MHQGKVMNVQGLEEGEIAYNINTISPSARLIDPDLYDYIHELGLVAIRVEHRHDKWRTPRYRPGVMAATHKGDVLTLRPDIFKLRAIEGSNTEGHEDARITIMHMDGHSCVIVSNVEVRAIGDSLDSPIIETVLYVVGDPYTFPWKLRQIAMIAGKDVEVEQLPNRKGFMRMMRPTEKHVAGMGVGRVVLDIVETVAQLSNGFEHAHLLSYPAGEEIPEGAKEGGNQIVFILKNKEKTMTELSLEDFGVLLLQHRAIITELLIDTGDFGENFEQNHVRYVAYASFIQDLNHLVDDKYVVAFSEKIATVDHIDGLLELEPKEARVNQVLFTGGISGGHIVAGAKDAYPVIFAQPTWIVDLLK